MQNAKFWVRKSGGKVLIGTGQFLREEESRFIFQNVVEMGPVNQIPSSNFEVTLEEGRLLQNCLVVGRNNSTFIVVCRKDLMKVP